MTPTSDGMAIAFMALGQTFVLLEKNKGEYERRTVKTGAEFGGVTEILEGVTPQDRVVSTGGVLLKRDAR